MVPLIATKDGEGQAWWVEWTGLAADVVKSGFFASVLPTMNNQREIAAALAILVSARAAIIEKGRRDTLSWIEWATQALYRTHTVVIDLSPGWRSVQVIGEALAIIGKGRIITPAGAIIALAGFLAESLVPEERRVEFRHTAGEVLASLDEEIENLHSELDAVEAQYLGSVKRLRGEIYAIHSYNLELYDLTTNDPAGSGRDPGGLTVEVEDILRLAERCYDAAEGYQRLPPIVAGTSQADRHLAGRDGTPTTGDTALLEVRDQFEQLLRTTCARYLLAADQVRRAAKAYAELEDTLRESFSEIMSRWGDRGIGQVEVGFDPALAATETHPHRPRVNSVFDLYRTFDILKRRAAQLDDYVTGDE